MHHVVCALVFHWGHNPKSDLAFTFNHQFIGKTDVREWYQKFLGCGKPKGNFLNYFSKLIVRVGMVKERCEAESGD